MILKPKLLYVGENDNRKIMWDINLGLKEDFYFNFVHGKEKAFEDLEQEDVNGVILVGKQNLVFPKRLKRAFDYWNFIDDVQRRGLGLAAVLIKGQDMPSMPCDLEDIEKKVCYHGSNVEQVTKELRDYFRGYKEMRRAA